MRTAPTPALARLEAAYTASSSGTLPGPGRALLESAELQGDEYGCSEERHDRRDLLEPKPRGVNLGGWLVAERWLVGYPSNLPSACCGHNTRLACCKTVPSPYYVPMPWNLQNDAVSYTHLTLPTIYSV